MPLPAPIFLVRHGRDKSDGSGELSGAGIEHAGRARDALLAQSLGQAALILSASSPRAMQTAEIIAKGLLDRQISAPVIQGSAELNRQGAIPDPGLNLDKLLIAELEAAGHPIESASGSLIVVTSSPLIAVAQGLTLPDDGLTLDALVPYGSVTLYTPSS